MRNFSNSLILLVLLLSLGGHASAQSSLEKLKGYSSKDLQVSTTKNAEAVGEKTQEILKTVQDTVDALVSKKENSSPELLKELVRVSFLTFANDPSEAAAEMLLPLYKKDKKALEEAIKSLPKEDAKELRESLKNAEREQSQGNG